MSATTCIFDAYGTLFDVSAAARDAAGEPGRERLAACWQEVAEHWRQKQLAYTWLRQITGDYVDFWQVTQDALDWALEANGLADADLRTRLLDLYRELAAYPEVPDVLSALKAEGLTCAILSNGSPDMLEAAVGSAGIGDLLDDVLSVHDIQTFKPAPEVYEMVGRRFDCTAEEVLFVSSNGWDVAGAALFGFRAAWVNRRGEPVDRLSGRPAHVLRDLRGLSELVSA